MTFVELFAPKGVLSEAQRRHLSERLVTELMSADGAPPHIIERGRALAWLVIHEPDVWTIGGRPVDPAQAPPYLVRVHVPGGHLNDGMKAEVITRITRVLAEIDEHPQRLYQEPHAWVHIVELPNGNVGAFGQIMRLADIVKMVVDPAYRVAQPDTHAGEPAPATAIDPICGMTVVLDETAITIEHNSITYAFCHIACRDIFAGQQGVVTPTWREQ